jgi:tRNA 2-thiouridine synthesizing protein A
MVNSYELNCDGLVCPMPVAKTKRKLLEMEEGDFLEVRGDFGEAGDNIRRYVENQGHKIVDFSKNGEHYYLKIQKV